MEVYYIRRRNGDIAVADLRKVSCLGNHKEEKIFICHSLPLSEDELDRAKENIKKGISKKLSQEITRRHGLEMHMVSIICAVVIFFGVSIATNYTMSMINRCLLAAVGFGVSRFLTHNLFHMSLKVIRAKDKYGYRVDGMEAINMDEIREVEKYYEGLYEYDLRTLIVRLANGTLPGYEGNLSSSLLIALECYLADCSKLVYRYADNMIHHRVTNIEAEIGHLETDTATGLLDIHLLALFIGLNKKI